MALISFCCCGPKATLEEKDMFGFTLPGHNSSLREVEVEVQGEEPGGRPVKESCLVAYLHIHT